MQWYVTHTEKHWIEEDGWAARILVSSDRPVWVDGVNMFINGCKLLHSNVGRPRLT